MLKSMFGDQQMETLADIIQTALMLRCNERRVWAERLCEARAEEVHTDRQALCSRYVYR